MQIQTLGKTKTAGLSHERHTFRRCRQIADPGGLVVKAHGAGNDWLDGNGCENRMLRLAVRTHLEGIRPA